MLAVETSSIPAGAYKSNPFTPVSAPMIRTDARAAIAFKPRFSWARSFSIPVRQTETRRMNTSVDRSSGSGRYRLKLGVVRHDHHADHPRALA